MLNQLNTYAEIDMAVYMARTDERPEVFELVRTGRTFDEEVNVEAIENVIRHVNGRMRVRTIDADAVVSWMRAAHQRGKAAMLDRNGGVVANSYGHPAETAAVAMIAMPVPEGFVFVGWIRRVSANHNARLACPHLLRSHAEYKRSNYSAMLATALGRRVKRNARDAARALLLRPEFKGTELVGVFHRSLEPMVCSGYDLIRHIFQVYSGGDITPEAANVAEEFNLKHEPFDIGRWLVFVDALAEKGLVSEDAFDLMVNRLHSANRMLLEVVK